jgi:hypothetical protein
MFTSPPIVAAQQKSEPTLLMAATQPPMESTAAPVFSMNTPGGGLFQPTAPKDSSAKPVPSFINANPQQPLTTDNKPGPAPISTIPTNSMPVAFPFDPAAPTLSKPAEVTSNPLLAATTSDKPKDGVLPQTLINPAPAANSLFPGGLIGPPKIEAPKLDMRTELPKTSAITESLKPAPAVNLSSQAPATPFPFTNPPAASTQPAPVASTPVVSNPPPPTEDPLKARTLEACFRDWTKQTEVEIRELQNLTESLQHNEENLFSKYHTVT